jgi:hypothetical protein
MTTAISNPSVADYVTRIAASNPTEAVQIALAEVEREKQIAQQARAEYLAMAELTFNRDGSIAGANLAGLYRLAQMYSRTGMIPAQYQQRPDDCFIAIEMAFRLGIAPLAYMQASYVVHGKPGIEAKLAIALLNKSGRIKGSIRWRFAGENQTRECTAYATDAATGEEISMPVNWAMVRAEGWDKKSGSKWVTMPDTMFRYRSAAFLIRAYYPEVLMGIEFADELQDETEAKPAAESPQVKTIEDLTRRLQNGRTVEAAKPAPAPEVASEPEDETPYEDSPTLSTDESQETPEQAGLNLEGGYEFTEEKPSRRRAAAAK